MVIFRDLLLSPWRILQDARLHEIKRRILDDETMCDRDVQPNNITPRQTGIIFRYYSRTPLEASVDDFSVSNFILDYDFSTGQCLASK